MSLVQSERSPLRQATGIALVLLLHVGIIYALVSGLGRQVVEVLRKPLETRIIAEPKTTPPPPPLAPPPLPRLAAPPPPYIPPPEIQIRSAPPPVTAITAVTTVKPAEPVPFTRPPEPVAAPPAPAVRLPAVIDAARSCQQPEYPPISRRMGETGTVVLQFLIDVDGRVIDSKIDNSSGHPRLDEAARAALALCRFKPGSLDGKPEQSWAKLRYDWKQE